MLDMIIHLFRLFGHSWARFISAIGSTTLGFIIPLAIVPLVGFVITILVKWLVEGRGLRQHVKTSLMYAAVGGVLLDFVVYCPILLWNGIATVYDDHRNLVAETQDLNGRLTAQGTKDQKTLRDLHDKMQGEITDLKVSCAAVEGSRSTLEKQNRDQQNSVNNCQNQAIKLSAPQPLKITPIDVSDFDSPTTQNRRMIKLLLLVNRTVTPVDLKATCTGLAQTVNGPDAFSMAASIKGAGEGIVMGSTIFEPPQSLHITINSPAWGPDSPLLIEWWNASNFNVQCQFKKQ